jgi:hypothetical protein
MKTYAEWRFQMEKKGRKEMSEIKITENFLQLMSDIKQQI